MDPLAQAVLIWDQGPLAPDCERGAVVKAGVEAYLGRPVFGADPSLVIRVRVARAAGQVEATVSQEDDSGRAWGERRVSAKDCESLDEPLTLVVALMVDASSTTEPIGAVEPKPPAPEVPAEEPPPPLDASPQPIETVPSLQHPRTDPGHWAVFASALATMGLLPDAAFGVGLDARWKPSGFWGLSVDAAVLAPQREQLDGGSLSLRLMHAGVGVCPLQGSDTTTWWSACGSLSVGRLRARSLGLQGARSKTELFAMPGLNVTGAWLPRGWLLVGAGLEGSFPVSPDRYLYRDAQGTSHLAFQVNPFALTARLAVGLIVR